MSDLVVEKSLEEKTSEKYPLQFYVDLLQGLYAAQDLPGLKFAEKVSANIKKLEEVLKPLNEVMKPTEEFEKFVQEVQMKGGGNYDLIAEMEKQNAEIVKERNDQVALAKDMLKEETFVKLYKIAKTTVPNHISARQFMALEYLLY